MFSFKRRQASAPIERQPGHLKRARPRWPSLTNFDARIVSNQSELTEVVRERCPAPRERAPFGVGYCATRKGF